MSRDPAPDSADRVAQLEEALERANSQLLLYARDFRHKVMEEQERSHQLDLANRQLQAYAQDLKVSVHAERERAQELERAYLETVRRLIRASRYRDVETGGHLQRLSHYSKVLALHLGLEQADAERIAGAAPMHDLGKIGIPDAVLRKPGPLDADEWKLMTRHPAIGASLLKGSTSPLIETAREIALTHHERWDGSGYPQGLRGESTPICGRIAMLVDVYDALRGSRCYKEGWDHDRVVDIIMNGDGRSEPAHFDPQLRDAFRDLHPRFARIYRRIAE